MNTKPRSVTTLFLLYSYITACLVVASPLLFIPFTHFSAFLTNYLFLVYGTIVALIFYVLYLATSRSWKQISRTEYILYTLFILVILANVIFSPNKKVTFFGNDIALYSAGSLLLLPVITMLVRSLTTGFRELIKRVLLGIMSIVAILFSLTFLFQNGVTQFVAKLFQSHASLTSLGFAVSLVSVVSLFVVTHTSIKKRYKLFIALLACGVLVCAFMVARQGDIRPSAGSSLIIARSTLLEYGPFGFGAGEHVRPWQMYRPQGVVESPFFDMDFIQGFGTFFTFLTTLGVIGTGVFLVFVLFPIIRAFREAMTEKNERERFVGFALTGLLLYFFVAAWFVPLSYAMLFVWFALIGLVYGRDKKEHAVTWKLRLPLVAVLGIVLLYGGVLAQKARAFSSFENAKQLAQSGDAQKTLEAIEKAIMIAPIDGFYRAKSDLFVDQAVKVVTTSGLSEQEMTTMYGNFTTQAVEAALKASELGKDTYQNYVTLGRAYELALPLAGKATKENTAYHNAKLSYEKAAALYPSNPYIRLMIGRLEASVGEKESAKKSLKEAIATKKNFGDALYLMSQLAASEKNVDDAILYAVEAIKASPNDPKGYMQAGLLFYGRKDYQGATLALQRALELDPTNGTVAYFLALTFRDAGQADAARQIAEALFAQNRDSKDVKELLRTLNTSTEVQATSSKTR